MVIWSFRTGAACAAVSVLALAGCGDDHSPAERRTEFGVVGSNDSETNGTYNWKTCPRR